MKNPCPSSIRIVFQAKTYAKVLRAIVKAKTMVSTFIKQRKKMKRDVRVHSNWSIVDTSSEEKAEEVHDSGREMLDYDPSWSSVFFAGHEPESKPEHIPGNEFAAASEVEEIDRLAEKFIATFHEKFRLEKQESYRRYQDMLARSI
ncbi:hypothetical protein AMTRI_Chr03g138730 [Amborella trichopoda]|uniref:DUF761 domain-containing protein n=1 Tax=Amborella trichopoda TaxID=13333 RepID=W1PNJ8_AMBTC|nr:uncharacterized protein LOC18439801 [Amborella trichopoda]ERN11602.1 hypothetical protein AMTR_s00022p00186920 [Amborella trichopoda]|eukprot:XP_006850021.1 uncharacterized protein LOC18439801 [Amborella trichopoda]